VHPRKSLGSLFVGFVRLGKAVRVIGEAVIVWLPLEWCMPTLGADVTEAPASKGRLRCPRFCTRHPRNRPRRWRCRRVAAVPWFFTVLVKMPLHRRARDDDIGQSRPVLLTLRSLLRLASCSRLHLVRLP